MRYAMPREFYIPKGATKVADKSSDAVVYVYENPKGYLAAIAFAGKAAKPVWHFRFRNAAEREARVRGLFESRRGRAEAKAESRRERNQPHSLEVGHILKTSWGYEQTNIEFFQVTAIIGTTMVEVREISQVRDDGAAYMTGTATPRLDDFIGKPLRRRVNAKWKTVSIDDCRTAHLWDGKPANWTAYA